ncbi:MAG: DNA polymerase III subunit gamma/tau [Verrucomicrobiales bacterium]
MFHVSYQVFARKYRPQTFDDILGQDHVVQTLRNAIGQNRLAHAYLFVGPRGTGKTSTARILAKALNCSGGPTVDFDPGEDICVEIAEGRSLDVLEIDGASNRGIDEVRELRESVKYAPTRGKFKIYYIDEVHMLTTPAFNALLKTLEEPPAHVKFIFATTEPTKILPTIISRCQRFDLRRIPDKIISDHLLYIAKTEGITLEPAAAHAIARGAEGGMRDAQSMLDQLVAFCGETVSERDVLDIFGFTGYETVSCLSDKLLSGDTPGALAGLHEQVEMGKDLSRFLADLIGHFRNLLVYKVDPAGAVADLPDTLVADLKRQAENVSGERLLALIDAFAETDSRMKWAPNKKLHFEVGLIRAARILTESTLGDVIGMIDAALAGQPGPSASPSVPPPPSPPGTATGAGMAAAAPSSPPAKAESPAPAPQQEDLLSPPVPSTPGPPEPAADPSDTTAPAGGGDLSGKALWEALLHEIEANRPLASAWLRAGHFHDDAGRYFEIAFAPEDAFSCDSLKRPNNKSFIEKLLASLSGRQLSLKLETRSNLQSKPKPEPVAEEEPIAKEEEPVEAPTEPPRGTGPEPTAGDAPPSPGQKETDRDDFHDDPLIAEALKVFEAELQ